jgi:hypothetical protein
MIDSGLDSSAFKEGLEMVKAAGIEPAPAEPPNPPGPLEDKRSYEGSA